MIIATCVTANAIRITEARFGEAGFLGPDCFMFKLSNEEIRDEFIVLDSRREQKSEFQNALDRIRMRMLDLTTIESPPELITNFASSQLLVGCASSEVSGTASITGRNEFYFDPEDPFREGFIL